MREKTPAENESDVLVGISPSGLASSLSCGLARWLSTPAASPALRQKLRNRRPPPYFAVTDREQAVAHKGE
jgi:hypothetical protein